MARRRRRRTTRARRRSRRNGPFTSTAFASNPRRRRRSSRRRRSYRRNYYSVVSNPPRRRGRRRGGFGGGGGQVSINKLLPLVGAGVGAGLVLGYATPMVVSRLGIVPSGPVYRLVQAGIAVGGAMLAQRFRLIGGQAATSFAAYGATVAAIGLVNDLGILSGLGIGGPVQSAAAAPPPTAAQVAGYMGNGGSMGYYESGSYVPYGQASPSTSRMSGYYRLA